MESPRPVIKPTIPERKIRPVPPNRRKPLKPLLPVKPRAATAGGAKGQNISGCRQMVPLGDQNNDEFLQSGEKTDPFEFDSLYAGIQFEKLQTGKPQISDEIRFQILPPIPERKVRPIPPPGGKPLKPLRPVHPRTAGGTEGQDIFRSGEVVPLDDQNYDEFIKNKEKTLVMFYDPLQYEESIVTGLQFGKAADESHQSNHAFASVDCSLQNEICCREGIRRIPMLKLYSNGFELSRMEYVNDLQATQLRMLLAMTPVLHQPMGRPPNVALPRRK